MQFIPSSADAQFDASPAKWWEEVRKDIAEPRPGRRLAVHLKLSATPSVVGAEREKLEAQKQSAANRLVMAISEIPHATPKVAGTTTAIVDSKTGASASAAADLKESQPRYSLTVVDAKGARAKGTHSFAVLLVPQGREHEWVLNSPAGQAQLANDANYGRLCFVTLNRGHAFTSLDAVKQELAEYMKDLSPERNSTAIPYLTVDKQSSSGIGQRTIVAALNTKHNGEVVVEDVSIPADKTVGAHSLRRLVFLSSRLIQSEARIRVGPLPSATGVSARKQKKKEKAKAKKAAESTAAAPAPAAGDAAKPDTKVADTKVAAAPAPASATAVAVAEPTRIDYGWLSCSYYRGMVAGLAAVSKADSILLLGLGGGSITMFLSEFLPTASIHAVELDPEVVALAQTYFGFKTSPRLTVEVNDGMAVVNALHASIAAARDKYKGVAFEAPKPTATADTTAAADKEAAAKATAEADKKAAGSGGGGGGGGKSTKEKRKAKKDSDAKKEANAVEQKRVAALAAAAAAVPGPEHPEVEKLKRDVIIVDINATDFSLGLSFPPAPFVAPAFLERVRGCVPSHGAVIWNLGCRNADLRRQILVDISKAFEEVYEIVPDPEDVNHIIIALPYRRFPAPTREQLLKRVLQPPANTFVPASALTPFNSSAAAPTATAADGSSFDASKHLYSWHHEFNLSKLVASMHVLQHERSATVVAEPKLSVLPLPHA